MRLCQETAVKDFTTRLDGGTIADGRVL
jgi:hypothetical protein